MMPKIEMTKGKFPEGFDDNAAKVFDVIHTVMSETTKAAQGDGIDKHQLISAIMSATITELVDITNCPHCAANILGKAAESVMSLHEGAPEHERVH